MTTIHPKLIETVAKAVCCPDGCELPEFHCTALAAESSDPFTAVIEALRPLMERIAAYGSRLAPASLTVAHHLAADPKVKPSSVESPKPQSLREKLLACGSLLEVRQVIEDQLPEGGPPPVWELEPGQCLAMDDDGDIVLSNLWAFDSGTILGRWPARKP